MITRVPCQIILVVCAASCSSDGALRLNQIQLKGTHNSYHRRPGLVLVSEHDYEHQPLDVQLEQLGVRVFELDIHQRSDGFLVYHLPVVDSRSTCRRLRDCLETVKRWSDSHTGHVPLFIWIEPKDDVDLLRRVDDFEALDAEILAVWPRQRLITPDLVRGERESLRAAIELDGWPRLDAVRGRAMFILLDTGKHRDAYLRGRRDAGALDGRDEDRVRARLERRVRDAVENDTIARAVGLDAATAREHVNELAVEEHLDRVVTAHLEDGGQIVAGRVVEVDQVAKEANAI